MTGKIVGEQENPFVKGSSKPKVEETIESRIKKEILKKQNNRLESKSIPKADLIKVVIEEAKECDNPDSNYFYKGTATVRMHISPEGEEKSEYQDFPSCNISGYALIDENNVELIGGTSIDSGLPKHINLF